MVLNLLIGRSDLQIIEAWFLVALSKQCLPVIDRTLIFFFRNKARIPSSEFKGSFVSKTVRNRI